MKQVKTDYANDLSYYKIAQFLKDYLDYDTIIICIGTDRCIGDCLGPLVGSMLIQRRFPLPVYGTLKDPIHALNIDSKLKYLKDIHPENNIIGIDACLGEIASVGEIQARDYPIHPGKGVGKSLPEVGTASIIGIVDSNSNSNLFNSNTIRLSFIAEMANVIVHALLHTLYLIEDSNNKA